MRPIRTAARALIIEDGRLLAIKMRDGSGIFYILPGGGQRHGETLVDGLKRECAEEIGSAVEVGDLVYVREYIGRNHAFSAAHKAFHQVENVFECRLVDAAAIGTGTAHDKKQVGVEWLPVDRLADYRLLPSALADLVGPDGPRGGTRYLGDTN